MPKINPTTTKAWKALQAHFEETKNLHIKDFFAEDGNRGKDFSISWKDFFVDVSKNRITPKTRELLLQLAEEVQLEKAIKAQFSGQKINETEERAVLHTALRDFSNMKPEVAASLQKMKDFSEKINNGVYKGATGKAIDTIVNIGIGGSHLGPEMVYEALAHYRKGVQLCFISNIDGDAVQATLDAIDPESTLFVVVSKSFTTKETLANAQFVKNWFISKLSKKAITTHFLAVSANATNVTAFGISEEKTFPMWDWVGGRFSLWSAAGFSVCCAIGYENFEDLLKGAHQMDVHFATAPFSENIPVALGLISVWYTNFYTCETEAVIPYCEALHKLIPYLQQSVMESNGKGIDRNGEAVNYQTGGIVWGATGTNAQHAFFQLLHQGTKIIPTDFICFTNSLRSNLELHEMLLANCLAQTEALATGKPYSAKEPYSSFTGNKPTTTIFIQELTPKNLGSLLAMYEHKIYVQGVVWNIFSYDQWGVQLGKEVATAILENVALLNGEHAIEYLEKRK
ncbi:glucose-6-phosphate isomerase [Rasiella sp. SM2506]|uniref:glucose-6-phosphate isomerase n=1 Tax=Rasiella sp. SM2506 TaxID=3423914 RepID=UPI003D7AF724